MFRQRRSLSIARTDGAMRSLPAISLSAHGHFKAQLTHPLLIIVRTILGPPIGMVDAARWWIAQRNSIVERLQCQILLELIADSPSNNTTRMQVDHHGQIQPSLPRPDITNVASPLLVGPFSAWKLRSNQLGAMLKRCLLSVVALYLRVLTTRMPLSRIKRPTRGGPQPGQPPLTPASCVDGRNSQD